MNLADFARLKKFMALSASANDNEALAALRMAGALLARHGLNWERVLDRSVTIVAAVEPDEAGDRIETLLAQAAASGDDGIRPFIASLREQWTQKHWLSPKQLAALERIVVRA